MAFISEKKQQNKKAVEKIREVNDLPTTTAHRTRLSMFGAKLRAEPISNKEGFVVENPNGKLVMKGTRPGQKQATLLEWIFSNKLSYSHDANQNALSVLFDPYQCLWDLGYKEPKIHHLEHLLESMMDTRTTMWFEGHKIFTRLIMRHSYATADGYNRNYEILLDERMLFFLNADTCIWYPELVLEIAKIPCGETQAVIRAILTQSPTPDNPYRIGLIKQLEYLEAIPKLPKIDMDLQGDELVEARKNRENIIKCRNKILGSVRRQFATTSTDNNQEVNAIKETFGVVLLKTGSLEYRHKNPLVRIINPTSSKTVLTVEEPPEKRDDAANVRSDAANV